MAKPKKVRFTHTFVLAEEEKLSTKTRELIDNLNRIRSEYGASSLDFLIKKMLIAHSYEDMVCEISSPVVPAALRLAPDRIEASVQEAPADEDAIPMSRFAPD